MEILRRLRDNTISRNGASLPIIVGLVMAAGMGTLLISRAATSFVAVEAEAGALANCAAPVNDAAASGGKAVRFGGCTTPAPGGVAGAQLPISYNLATLTGTQRYVAPSGNDTTGSGTVTAPFATLGRAYTAAVAGDSIVVRGGTYRQGNLSFNAGKAVTVIAYPGEIPVFNGAQLFNSGWTAEGALKWHAYAPRPATDGSGISFTTGQNLAAGGIGKYPDQAWSGSTQLREMLTKAEVTAGRFWVDRAAGRIYVAASDADSGSLEASAKNVFLTSQAAGTRLEGLRVTRFSNTAADYGVIKFLDSADNSVMQHVEVSDTAFIAVMYGGSANLNNGGILRNVTLTASNWMGIDANYTDNLLLDRVKITRMNQFGEFTFSPQSGALKTSRTRFTKVINSQIADNNSHGLWFDQSNVDVDVAGNTITNNAGSSVFFEISDDLLLVNNYIQTRGGNAVKLAGSSGLKLVNNTIIGGPDAVGIYVDNRSKPGCADPAAPLCTDSYGSDRDTVRPRPATLDWIPRLDLMMNNIIAYPTANGFCGGLKTVCITGSNGAAVVPITTVIHKADSLRPQTQINGNVYANGANQIITAGGSYATHAAFGTAMAGSPVGITGFETAGLTGNTYVSADGSPSAQLSGVHAQAAPIPTNANINQYIPVGSRHYGVLNR